MQTKANGFTLIEILVALFVFAIMGVLAAMSLHSMMRVHHHLKKVDQQITALQMTMTLLRRDMTNVIDRTSQNSGGEVNPPFFASDREMMFTRTGLSNPLNMAQQSNMERVGYLFSHHQLIRLTWTTLDTQFPKQPAEQILLRHIKSLQWQFLSSDGKIFSTWPPSTISTQQTTPTLPRVVLMVMYLNHSGVVQGVFPVPARG